MNIVIHSRGLKATPEINGFKGGYALDYHTISSLPRDGDPYCRFDTKRTPLGELVYNIKYKKNVSQEELQKYINYLAQIAHDFIKQKWGQQLDCIVPAPYSLSRKIQPVVLLAQQLAQQLGCSFSEALYKGRQTKAKKL